MKKAFTFVEIMIAVVIIALLAAMAIPAFQKVRQNAELKRNKQKYVRTVQPEKPPEEIVFNGHKYRLVK